MSFRIARGKRLNPVFRCLRKNRFFSVLPESSAQERVDSETVIPEEIFKSGSKSGSYKIGDSSFYSLIDSYANSGNFGYLEKVFERMKCENRVFLERSFIAVFKAYGRARLPEKAVDLFYRMADEFRCKRTVRSFNSVLNVIIRAGLNARAVEFYSSVVSSKDIMITPNLLSFNLIIKSFCKMGSVDRAVEIFREMTAKGSAPDVFTYCTLMDGLCREERIDEAVSLLDEMQTEGCFPNPVTFNVLLNGLCKKGDLARASKLVDNMFLKGCLPNEITYNTLIHGLCLKGKLDKAVQLLNRMVDSNCVPNDVTYGTIINGFVKAGRTADGVSVLNFMEERSFPVNQHIYSSVLKGLFKEEKYEEARIMWKKMVERGSKPNDVVYGILMEGLSQEGRPDEAEELLQEMMSNGITPNAFVYSSLLKNLFRNGSSEKALLLWKEMENKKCAVNEFCYSVMLQGLCSEGKLQEATVLWNDMLGRGFKPDTVAYTTLIHGHCNSGEVEKGLELFNQMLYQDPLGQPDVVTYNILLDALCKNSSTARAISFLNNMMDQGCDPDAVTCNIFLKALRERFDPPQDGKVFLDELVLRLFKRERILGAATILEVMLQKHLPPTALAWEKAVQHLCKPRKDIINQLHQVGRLVLIRKIAENQTALMPVHFARGGISYVYVHKLSINFYANDRATCRTQSVRVFLPDAYLNPRHGITLKNRIAYRSNAQGKRKDSEAIMSSMVQRNPILEISSLLVLWYKWASYLSSVSHKPCRYQTLHLPYGVSPDFAYVAFCSSARVMLASPTSQGVQFVLESDCKTVKSSSLRKTLSADVSSKQWSHDDRFLGSDSFSHPQDDGREDTGGKRVLEGQNRVDSNWSFLLTQKVGPGQSTEPPVPPPYVHPLVKSSARSLSSQSLEICTESLGFETGSGKLSSSPPLESGCTIRDESKQLEEKLETLKQTHDDNKTFSEKHEIGSGRKRQSRNQSFPPPIPSLCYDQQGETVHMNSRRNCGRLILEAVSVSCSNNFEAQRGEGRLVLAFSDHAMSKLGTKPEGEEIGEESDEITEELDERLWDFDQNNEKEEEIEYVDAAEEQPLIESETPSGSMNGEKLVLRVDEPISVPNSLPSPSSASGMAHLPPAPVPLAASLGGGWMLPEPSRMRNHDRDGGSFDNSVSEKEDEPFS